MLSDRFFSHELVKRLSISSCFYIYRASFSVECTSSCCYFTIFLKFYTTIFKVFFDWRIKKKILIFQWFMWFLWKIKIQILWPLNLRIGFTCLTNIKQLLEESLFLTFECIRLPNDQTHFQHLAAFAARFLNCAWLFWDILHKSLTTKFLEIADTHSIDHREKHFSWLWSYLTLLNTKLWNGNTVPRQLWNISQGVSSVGVSFHCVKSVQIQSY